jgi:hypothetical protein
MPVYDRKDNRKTKEKKKEDSFGSICIFLIGNSATDSLNQMLIFLIKRKKKEFLRNQKNRRKKISGCFFLLVSLIFPLENPALSLHTNKKLHHYRHWFSPLLDNDVGALGHVETVKELNRRC